ncbi:DUF4145 domain-containing protein [Sinorhizobium meliloti]|nr:DUF4145 domain-containing protein [Sinorhizobium meliloti]MDX0325512.1 DUF4145 domain-containing protein [Sinorhizobium meliloti]
MFVVEQKKVQHICCGESQVDSFEWEIQVHCLECHRSSIYGLRLKSTNTRPSQFDKLNLASQGSLGEPIHTGAVEEQLDKSIPSRVSILFKEASFCRQMGKFEAAGAIYRKTLDVATKLIYAHDLRLQDKNAASNLRPRIKALGELGIIDAEIVELADVAALDGNDAVHDMDPYTAAEAEALEYLTRDLLDRLFVRPARIAAVKAKQIAAGQRSAV